MKYKNVKTFVDGISFDSRKESARYAVLKLMQKAGVYFDQFPLKKCLEVVCPKA